jgi:hypothetical protein
MSIAMSNSHHIAILPLLTALLLPPFSSMATEKRTQETLMQERITEMNALHQKLSDQAAPELANGELSYTAIVTTHGDDLAIQFSSIDIKVTDAAVAPNETEDAPLAAPNPLSAQAFIKREAAVSNLTLIDSSDKDHGTWSTDQSASPRESKGGVISEILAHDFDSETENMSNKIGDADEDN